MRQSLAARGGKYAVENARKPDWMRNLALSEGGASSNALRETDCITRDGAENVRLTHVLLGTASSGISSTLGQSCAQAREAV